MDMAAYAPLDGEEERTAIGRDWEARSSAGPLLVVAELAGFPASGARLAAVNSIASVP